jgi:ubiquinone/menaquinone biosynthesis C-methylase UbiE
MELIADEVAFLQSLVPLAGAHVAELGCGKADFARALIGHTGVARVDAFEVDRIQHAKNLESAANEKITFRLGGAEAIDLPGASLDGVVMMKSLHHVPMEQLDRALAEIRRVLKPGGWLYVSEPVYAGEFNEIVKLFHDEGEVRAAAQAAVRRAAQARVLDLEVDREFMAPLAFRDFADFEAKVIGATHSAHVLTREPLAEVRQRFEAYMTPEGAKFTRPMRVQLMRRALPG